MIGLRSARALLLPAALVLAGASCASDARFTRSGFLPGYEVLVEQDAPAGGRRLAWVDPAFTPERYGALLIDPVVFFPEPRPSPQVPAETLAAMRDLIDASVRRQLGARVALSQVPGPGVARWQMAVTALRPRSEELQPWEYVPVALLVTGARAAVEGGLPQQPHVALELKITDSQSGAPLLLLVRGGEGGRLHTAKVGGLRPVTIESLRELFEHWAEVAAEQVGQFVKPL